VPFGHDIVKQHPLFFGSLKYPESFSKEWWEMISFVHSECKRLGMRLWLYDQLGYGQYGWFEKAAATPDRQHEEYLAVKFELVITYKLQENFDSAKGWPKIS